MAFILERCQVTAIPDSFLNVFLKIFLIKYHKLHYDPNSECSLEYCRDIGNFPILTVKRLDHYCRGQIFL